MKPKLLAKTQPGTPVYCIPMIGRENACIGMIFKTPQRTFVLGDFEYDCYMRSDGWSGVGHDPVAMLENYCHHMDDYTAVMTTEMTIKKEDISESGFDCPVYEVTFTDQVLLTFVTFNEV